MLDICLLGSGGMMPIPGRWLTSLMAKFNGHAVLIDCGEGTQIAIKEWGGTFKNIDVICITHFHADHVAGLPGLLLTIGNSDRTEPLTIIGPKGMRNVAKSLMVISPQLPFEVNVIEIEDEKTNFEMFGLYIDAFRLNHTVNCYGYSLRAPRKGKFDVEAAKGLGLPVRFWNRLQHGQEVVYDDKTYTPDMVMGEDRKGIKVTYCTDTRPVPNIVEAAKDADLFICEGMYGEQEDIKKARENKHMTFGEAAVLAKEAAVKKLWLTHYSPALVRPKDYLESVRNVFAASYVCQEGRWENIGFED